MIDCFGLGVIILTAITALFAFVAACFVGETYSGFRRGAGGVTDAMGHSKLKIQNSKSLMSSNEASSAPLGKLFNYGQKKFKTH